MYKEEFMKEAVALARKCIEAGEGGPFGVVIVKDGQIVGRGRNQVTTSNDIEVAVILVVNRSCLPGTRERDGLLALTSEVGIV